MQKQLQKFGLFSLFLFSSLTPLYGEEDSQENTYTINFNDVPVVEFINFVSKISDANFIFNHKDLQFNITLSSGKPVSSDHVVKALVQILRAHGLSIAKEEGYLVIHKGVMEEYASAATAVEHAPLRTYEKSQSLYLLTLKSSSPGASSGSCISSFAAEQSEILSLQTAISYG